MYISNFIQLKIYHKVKIYKVIYTSALIDFYHAAQHLYEFSGLNVAVQEQIEKVLRTFKRESLKKGKKL